MGGYHLQTSNLDRGMNLVIYSRDAPVVEHRAELAAQGVALAQLGETLEGGTTVKLGVEWQAQPTACGFLLEACRITVAHPENGAPVLQESISSSEIFLLETQAVIDALYLHHNIFRAGEHASSLLYFDGSEPPAPLEFNYTLPECDPSVTTAEATLTTRAARVIADLVGKSKDGEQRGFAVGVLGRKGVPVVTDILVPPADQEGKEASVEFSPESWAHAQQAVWRLGPPFRLLGPCHTHPAGMLKPSPDDWDLYQWGGEASSLFVVAAKVNGQPTAVGYRWVRGTLACVNLEIESLEPAAQEERV